MTSCIPLNLKRRNEKRESFAAIARSKRIVVSRIFHQKMPIDLSALFAKSLMLLEFNSLKYREGRIRMDKIARRASIQMRVLVA
jgi:hypothetical protein